LHEIGFGVATGVPPGVPPGEPPAVFTGVAVSVALPLFGSFAPFSSPIPATQLGSSSLH